jgi:trehalose 6-phosphate synthase/phosphatase
MRHEQTSSGRLLVVSNRLPLTLRAAGEGWRVERSAGGLATALGPVLARTSGLWLGWPGESPAAPDLRRERLLVQWRRRYGYHAVDLPAEVARASYEGYANRTIWPLFHDFPSRFEFDQAGWEAYEESNRRFRDAVLNHLQPGDRVWVHDYHLMLVPRLLREAAPETPIGFFLHIPFPPSEVFRLLPRREEVLRGLLGADLLGFHTHGDLQGFRRSLLRILGLESRMDGVEVDGRRVRLEAHPIGISAAEFEEAKSHPEGVAELAELGRRFQGQRILLAVDRLDYTKGIPERLRTFRRLLEIAPQLRGKVVLVQVAVPTRERIPRYAELRREVNEMVGELNGDFGTPEWIPVVYLRRGIPRPQLAALYTAADVAWVTPLRDGMNLVAKEYVVCQAGGAGALLLSEFAGAAAEMGEAFLVNPYDEWRTAEVLARVLELPVEERRDRLAELHRRVVRNDAFAWSERFLGSLDGAAAARRVHRPGIPPLLPEQDLRAAFGRAARRLLILDYDGTLVPYTGRPRDAAPPPALRRLLGALAADPADRVAVVSGRHRRDLEAFLGDVPGLWLAAEHGALLRAPGAPWEPLRPRLPTEWKERVRPVLEHFTDRTPGSFVEEKEYALVWHYRLSDPEFGEWLANELTATLDELLAETELKALRGQKSVEVRLTWANKGELAAWLLEAGPRCDFVVAMGDDRSDEDLFARLPDEAWTVHVGGEPTRARFRLPSPHDVGRVLGELALEAAALAREAQTSYK